MPQIAPVCASPFPQRAHDGVGDVSWCGGIGRLGARRGQGNGRTQAGLLGSRRALHPLSSSRLPHALSGSLPLVSAVRSLLHDSLHVVPESTLWAVIAAGGEFGYLERRVGLPLTAPLNGLQFAANAVHGVVPTGGLGRAAVHAAGCKAAVQGKSAKTQEKYQGLNNKCNNNSLLSGRQNENISKICVCVMFT